MPYTTAELAERLQGEVLGDTTLQLTGFAAANTAKPGDLTFAENAEYLAKAEESAASAILVSGAMTSSRKTLIRVPNARVGFAKVLPLFFPPPKFAPGIHPTAVIAPSAQIDPTAWVGPLCTVGERTQIGARSALLSGVHVGSDCRLGEEVVLHPNVTIYARSLLGNRVILHGGAVIGADGFGYVFDQGRHLKVPQIGNVIIHDDVEIGANSTVDRAALGTTVIGKGTKIDNLVQVGHNVVIGDHSILVAQVGVAGSTKMGHHVILGGQVGLSGHITLGNNVSVGGQSGVMTDIPDGEKWFGSPARPDKQVKRQMLAVMQLPELLKRFRQMEAQLAALTKNGAGQTEAGQ